MPKNDCDNLSSVKEYYKITERIDYVDFYNHFKGNESVFIRLRERELRKLIKAYATRPLIDVGCGTGVTLRNLPEESVGLDINPWNIRRAKKHAAKAHLIVGDIEYLPFRDKAFSTAICSEVLEHLEQPLKAVKEINRCLKSGGMLLGSVPHPSWIWRLNDKVHQSLSNLTLRKLLSRIRIISSQTSYSVPFHKLYTAEQARELMTIFRVIKNDACVFNLWVFFVMQKS
jgi:ubiquinone/menaquinone biosynthesis C-methylase UbiE